MIPAAFEYHTPGSIDEATALLAHLGEDAKILSGGQSLIPLMKLRLASPRHLVDINRIPGLDVRERGGRLPPDRRAHARVGSGSVRRSSARAIRCSPTRAEVIADPLVRNLATVGGNLAHADPANDHPATMLALGAEVSWRAGRRASARSRIGRLLHRAVRDRAATRRDPDRDPDPDAAAAQRRRLSEARAQGRRLRDGGGGRAGRALGRRHVRSGRDRAHQRRPDADQGHAGRGGARGQAP